MRSVLVIAAFALATAGAATAQGNPPQQQPSQQPPAQQPNRTEQPNRAEQPSREQQRPSASQMTVPEAQRPPQQQRERARPGEQGEGQPHRGPAPEEKTSVTHHTARIGGQQINYTATAATYVIRADDGSPKATMFYVAYTKDGADESKRPVSFVYNGGPGSASLFTHMGMGPKRVVLTADGHGMPAPYSIVDNEDSFLDATDLVFIDAISTGYSRPAPGENPTQFHGIIEDANWFADFIYQYITRNERWLSPKFLIGESYGTTRSAELSGVLQERHEIYLNGIVLVSTVAFANWGADDRAEFYLPTYVTTAWYHHLLQPDLQNLTVEQVAEKARLFAHGDYAAALAKGDTLTAEEHKKIVDEIAHYTALSPKYIEESNLRVSPFRWFRELERDKRLTVGRLDSRFTGMEQDAAGERPDYDPSEASYEGAFVATFHDYVRRELKWDSDMYYTVTANVRPWDQTGNTEVAEVLRAAMTQQTYLKVLVVCGYYDVATPFNGIEETVSHMHLEPSVRKNISFAYYEGGHMMYIDEKQHNKLHKDIDEFINSNYKH
ncbi:MAG TPA: peptidase S10 [Candidatus Angelobacter sp.]|nr:peptidase S10 [Candidatus Angelobacter sp.]